MEDEVAFGLAEPDAPVDVLVDVVLEDLVAVAAVQIQAVPARAVVGLADETVALKEIVARVLQMQAVDIRENRRAPHGDTGRSVDVLFFSSRESHSAQLPFQTAMHCRKRAARG